jgi:hypothetical protein
VREFKRQVNFPIIYDLRHQVYRCRLGDFTTIFETLNQLVLRSKFMRRDRFDENLMSTPAQYRESWRRNRVHHSLLFIMPQFCPRGEW